MDIMHYKKGIRGGTMKRALLLSLVLVLSIASTTWAALVTITFDEAFVTPGAVNNRYDGTQVSTQYAISPYGVTWADIYPSTVNPSYTGQVVCQPGEFNGPNFGTDNYLFIYGNNTGSGGGAQTATATLSKPSNYFSIEYRRPQADGTFDFSLYLGNTLVSDSGSLAWTPGDDWKTFTNSSVTFDKVVIWVNDKSSFDNFTINPVPIPSAIFLFAPGLVALVGLRRRVKK
jgi:hypothetical protein